MTLLAQDASIGLTGILGTVEIESEWTACNRGWQLPEWMRYRQLDFPFPVPKGEGPKPLFARSVGSWVNFNQTRGEFG